MSGSATASTATWSQVYTEPRPEAREGHVSFVHAATSRIFVLGGSVASALSESATVQTSSMWCYDAAVLGAWRRVDAADAAPEPASGAAAAVVGDRAYVIGGLSLSRSSPWHSDVHCLDMSVAPATAPAPATASANPSPNTNTKSKDTATTTPVSAAASAPINGGDPVWKKCDCGRSVVPGPSGRDKAGCVALPGGRIVVFGGFGPVPAAQSSDSMGEEELSLTWFNDVHVLNAASVNPATNSVDPVWEPVELAPGSPQPAPRCACAVAMIGADDILVFGGRTNMGGRANDFWKLNVTTVTSDKGSKHIAKWTELTVSGEIPPPCSFVTAVSTGRMVVLFGGRLQDNTHTADVYVLTPNTNPATQSGFQVFCKKASPSAKKPAGRGFHTSVVISNRMAVFGEYHDELLLLDLDTL
ncbi:hypothetical protein Pelo_4768 [Pelomyxa schiedti]|nr:hypothetical protein Pelo_4768 [Pelomyxa schiedti]